MKAWFGLLLLVCWACDDGDTGGVCFDGQCDPTDRDPPPDMRDMDPPDCGIDDPACHPPDPCDWTDTFDTLARCTDSDGDCRPGVCPDRIPMPLRDCDDQNAAIHPGAAELCNARDDDCDGTVDEALGLTTACEGCTGPGQLECHVSDPRRVACSTDYGQSAAPPQAPDERCNGLDDDCDARVDEACVVADGLDARAVRRCGQGALVLSTDGLTRWTPEIGATALFRGIAAAPTCDSDRTVWLELAPESLCGPQPEGPWACTQARLTSGRALEVEVEGTLGAPVVANDRIYLHRIVDGQIEGITVQGASLDVHPRLSDPVPIEAGVAGRIWTAQGPQLVRMVAEQPQVISGVVAPGPPSAGPVLAWITEDTAPHLWVAADATQSPVQVGPAVAGRPWVTEQAVYWRDARGVHRFDLQYGIQSSVLEGAIDAVDVSTDGMAWVVDGVLRLGAPGGR